MTGAAACTTTATTTSPAGAYPITCGPGTLHATDYAFTFVSGTLTVTNTTTLACLTVGSVTVSAGQSVRVAPGCTVIGSITVKTGGALDVEGALVLGALDGTGGTVRMCNSSFALVHSVSGPGPDRHRGRHVGVRGLHPGRWVVLHLGHRRRVPGA